jgi:imidazolonepropionase-like amidohydrolase
MMVAKLKRRSVLGVLLAGAATLAHSAPVQDADLMLYNGKVVTVDDKFSIQTTVVVRDGVIVAVGGQEVEAQYNAKTKIDLNGRMLMPGFNDTHIHIYALSPRAIELEDAKSIKEIQDRLRAMDNGLWLGRGAARREARDPAFGSRCGSAEQSGDADARRLPFVGG